tara:strand:+ start:124 stop:1113 length:990 start_codon:yes stop_codon:yes gene_type:complete
MENSKVVKYVGGHTANYDYSSLGQNEEEISFKYLESFFDPKIWHVGMITKQELLEVSLMPIKHKSHIYGADFTNSIHFGGLTNCLILSNDGHSWDYTHYNRACEIMDDSPYKSWFPVYTNFKEAALRAGLGVRARNSLIYDYRFGFDVHFTAIGINNTIVDIPTSRRHNTKMWNRCIDCDDCMVKCPVGAIRNKAKVNWLNSSDCNNMITFGKSDNKEIPSIKDFWHKNLYPEIPQEIVDKLSTMEDLEKYVNRDYGYSLNGHELKSLYFNWDKNGYTFDGQVIRKDGEAVNVPFCRECTSQPRCSKWNGKFPYERVGGKIKYDKYEDV